MTYVLPTINKAYDGKAQLERAKAADLVTLPKNITGTNCGNCSYIKEGFCTHKKVQQPVSARLCCAYWDAEGTIRPWEK